MNFFISFNLKSIVALQILGVISESYWLIGNYSVSESFLALHLGSENCSVSKFPREINTTLITSTHKR